MAVELVHLGSLYHDDVMDEAETRRGVETVNAKWGNLQAILAGDFLLSRASEIAASLGTEVAGLLANTIGRLCFGQIHELRHTYDTARTEDDYFTSVQGKTASLFGTAARIGGLVAGQARSHVDVLTAYGDAFGTVFQVVDDLLDLTASEAQLGKPAGHDLVEGVYTLPVVRTLAGAGADADELRALLGRPLDPAELDKALGVIRSNGAVPAAKRTAMALSDQAASLASTLPPGPVTRALIEAPRALVDSVG